MPEVNNGYVELFRVLGQHGLIGVILGVIAIFGVICLAVIWMLKGIVTDSRAFSDKVQELAVTVGELKAGGEANDKKDNQQDTILARHEDRLDDHEGRITVLEKEKD